MKRYLSVLLIIAMLITVFTGCQSKSEASQGEAKNDGEKKISVVTTIFPQYDFARQIAGDKADITMLLSPGAESHSYEPTPQDIIKIKNCDVFIYVGGENDQWVKSILDSIDTSKIKVISLLDSVKPLGEETKEGMEAEAEDAASADDGIEYDEHVWTSPQNAITLTNVIRDVLCYVEKKNSKT